MRATGCFAWRREPRLPRLPALKALLSSCWISGSLKAVEFLNFDHEVRMEIGLGVRLWRRCGCSGVPSTPKPASSLAAPDGESGELQDLQGSPEVLKGERDAKVRRTATLIITYLVSVSCCQNCCDGLRCPCRPQPSPFPNVSTKPEPKCFHCLFVQERGSRLGWPDPEVWRGAA